MKSSFETVNIDNITEKELLEVLDKNKATSKRLKEMLNKVNKLSISTRIIVSKEVFSSTSTKEINIQKEFEDEVDFYLNNLRSITEDMTKEEIVHLLPPTRKDNYERLLLRLKLESIKSLRDFNSIITEASNLGLQDFQFAQKEIQLEKMKLDVISSLLTKMYIKDVEENISVKNRFIFVPNSSGTIRILEELESIPQELYSSFNSLFQSIQDGTFKGVKRFTSSNTKIAGISEVRDIDTGARVVFDRVGKETYAIITAFIKKVMQSHGYHEQLERKIGNYKAFLTDIKLELNNTQYLNSQAVYEQRLWDKLQMHARCQKGGAKCKKK